MHRQVSSSQFALGWILQWSFVMCSLVNVFVREQGVPTTSNLSAILAVPLETLLRPRANGEEIA